jgi:hypothetical protein
VGDKLAGLGSRSICNRGAVPAGLHRAYDRQSSRVNPYEAKSAVWAP